ncbi:hypothetical protein ACA910_018460 [Epithemia clementina (nom. ined.)]
MHTTTFQSSSTMRHRKHVKLKQRPQQQQQDYIRHPNTKTSNNSNSSTVPSMTSTSSSSSSSLLSLDIIGFPKMGTSFLSLEWLPLHAHICLPEPEWTTWSLPNNNNNNTKNNTKNGNHPTKPTAIVATTQALLNLSSSTTRKSCRWRGFKNPKQIYQPSALQTLSREWPKAKFLVGVRHPVWWFQSVYNYKLRQGRLRPIVQQVLVVQQQQQQQGMNNNDTYYYSTTNNHNNHTTTNTTNTIITAATVLQYLQEHHLCTGNVCLHHAEFHRFLSYLGHTPLQSSHEWTLLGRTPPPTTTSQHHYSHPNPLFLYDLSQLLQANPTNHHHQQHQFEADLSHFLELSKPLPPLPRRKKRRRRVVVEPVAVAVVVGHLCPGARRLTGRIGAHWNAGRPVAGRLFGTVAHRHRVVAKTPCASVANGMDRRSVCPG